MTSDHTNGSGTSESPPKPRIGGMALGNGVLVHSPRYWACAVRGADGSIELASGEKPVIAAGVRSPVVRGVARIAEAMAVLPAVARALPEAELPHRSRRLFGVMAGASVGARLLRRAPLSPARAEVLLTALSLVPVTLAVKGSSVAAYHGAEHVVIGSWEHDEPRTRVHERCGSHLVAPLVATNLLGNLVAGRLARNPVQLAAYRGVATTLALGLSVELLSWAVRNPERPIADAIFAPGRWLQRSFLTAEPTDAELDVARAALEECVRLEANSDAVA